MTKREFLDIVFALAPTEANAIMDAFDEYVDSNEPHWIPVDLENNEPPLEEWVLVSSDGYVMQDCIVERGGKKIWYHGGNIQSDDRYMPLPEPYKGGDGMSIWLKPCPRCGAKNSHAIFSHNEKVTANGRTNYVRLIGIRCDDCGFSVDGYLRTIEAVRKWNALEVTE